MAPLSSLKSPALTEDILKFLAHQGLHKVEDLLGKDLYNFPWLGGQDASVVWKCNSTDTLEGLTQIQKAIRDALNEVQAGEGIVWRSGLELFHSLRQSRFVSTGCDSLDDLLQGGLRPGTITELIGPAASGKTQLCHMACASTALKMQGSAVFVDTSSSFAAKRLAHMLGGIIGGGRQNLQEHANELKEAMASVVCMRAHDIHGVLTLLDEISSRISAAGSQSSNFFVRMKLLVLDSAASVVSPTLGGGGQAKQGHSLMRCLGQSLKQLAINRNIAILMTNYVVAGDGGNLRPALGESWKNVAHVRLMLEKDPSAEDMCSLYLHDCVLANGVFNRKNRFRIGKDALPSAPVPP